MTFRACARVAILCTLGAVAGAAPVARQPDWHVSSLKANITVNSDSSLLVDETLVIPEGQDPNFGLRCEIPIGDDDRWDRNYGPGYTDDNGLRVRVQRVAVDGAPAEFRLDHYLRHGYQVIVRNGSQMNAVGQGTHELNVIYRVTGAIRPVGSDDELYWNAAGNMLSIGYDSMSVRVSLPAGVPGDSVQVTSYGGGRGRSVGPIGTDAGIETTILPDGAEFSSTNVRPRESLSIVIRWPQGFVHRPTGLAFYGTSYYLAPLLLLGIYLAARVYLRRNVERFSTAPQYEPPGGLSPAALRFIARGAVDGTSVAASLSSLAVRGYVAVEAKGRAYVFWRSGKCDTDLDKLPEEEAAIAELMFDPNANVADPMCGNEGDLQSLSIAGNKSAGSSKGSAQSVAFGPSDPRINVLVGIVYSRLKPQLGGKYFTWNAWIVLLGMLATLIFGVAVVLGSGEQSGSLFLVIWSFFFFQGFSSIVGIALLGRQRNPFALAIGALLFIGVTFMAAHKLAQDISWVPVASYMAMIVMNGVFLTLLRTPTREGQTLLAQIHGYKIFLEATERDRLTALGKGNAQPPNLQSLPYAIALDLKEPWGDAMANAFAVATTAF